MNQGRTIFAQLMDCFLSNTPSIKIVDKHRGDYRVRNSVLPGPVPRHGLRPTDRPREPARHPDLPARLATASSITPAFAARSRAARWPTPTNAAPGSMWADLTLALIAMARPLYAGEDFGVELEQTAYALDSTTIDLCLALFPWAALSHRPRPASSCTRCWICAAISPLSWSLPTAACTT